MIKTSKTIVFFGNERLATGVSTDAPTLEALVKAGYNVAAVVSHYEAGQSRKARVLEIDEVAKRHSIPVHLPEKPEHLAEELKAIGADVGVLVAYGKIVPQSLIDIFPKGIVNIHPSLLPLHRGPIPIESVILDGSSRTGVSIMALAKEMDAGPVYAQSEVKLDGQETKQHLADHLLDVTRGITRHLRR
jgi:methionyl-tRNA formyltransferase